MTHRADYAAAGPREPGIAAALQRHGSGIRTAARRGIQSGAAAARGGSSPSPTSPVSRRTALPALVAPAASSSASARVRRRRRVLGDRHLARLEPLEHDLDRRRDRDRQQRADERRRPLPRRETLKRTRNGEIPTVLRMTSRDEDVALDQLEDQVDAGRRRGRAAGDTVAADEHGRDRAEQRADDRDRLGAAPRTGPSSRRGRHAEERCTATDVPSADRRPSGSARRWTHRPRRVSAAFQTSRCASAAALAPGRTPAM